MNRSLTNVKNKFYWPGLQRYSMHCIMRKCQRKEKPPNAIKRANASWSALQKIEYDNSLYPKTVTDLHSTVNTLQNGQRFFFSKANMEAATVVKMTVEDTCHGLEYLEPFILIKEFTKTHNPYHLQSDGPMKRCKGKDNEQRSISQVPSRNTKTRVEHSRTPGHTRDEIRCLGGVSIPCRPVSPAVSP